MVLNKSDEKQAAEDLQMRETMRHQAKYNAELAIISYDMAVETFLNKYGAGGDSRAHDFALICTKVEMEAGVRRAEREQAQQYLHSLTTLRGNHP